MATPPERLPTNTGNRVMDRYNQFVNEADEAIRECFGRVDEARNTAPVLYPNAPAFFLRKIDKLADRIISRIDKAYHHFTKAKELRAAKINRTRSVEETTIMRQYAKCRTQLRIVEEMFLEFPEGCVPPIQRPAE